MRIGHSQPSCTRRTTPELPFDSREAVCGSEGVQRERSVPLVTPVLSGTADWLQAVTQLSTKPRSLLNNGRCVNVRFRSTFVLSFSTVKAMHKLSASPGIQELIQI